MSDVRYTNRDFASLKEALVTHAKTYFPDTFQNFSEGSLGMLYLELVAYAGDVLSFYTDRQFRESLLPYAEDRENVFTHAKQRGYEPRTQRPASATLSVYGIVPAKEEDGRFVPDFEAVPNIRSGMVVQTDDGVTFRVNEPVRFEPSPDLEVTPYEQDAYGDPATFLVRTLTEARSGAIRSAVFEFSDAEPFARRFLSEDDVIEVLDVEDSEGNAWHEVQFLAQDRVFVEEDSPNTDEKRIALRSTPRRFKKEVFSDGRTAIQFGGGFSPRVPPLEDLQFLDPQQLVRQGYGEIPKDTFVEVRYLVGGGDGANVPAGRLNVVSEFEFEGRDTYPEEDVEAFESSIRVTNPSAATGGAPPESTEEIRKNALAAFASQNRVITKQDYESRILSMPNEWGAVSKVEARVQHQHVEIRMLTQNREGHWTPPNDVVKQNVREFLSLYQPLGTTIEILDPYVVNLAAKIEISTLQGAEETEVKKRVIQTVSDFFRSEEQDLDKPVILSHIRDRIQDVQGVRFVSSLEFENRFAESEGYSGVQYDVQRAQRDGVIYPSKDPSIFSIRFPERDIQVRIAA